MRPTLTTTAIASLIESGTNQMLLLDPAGRAQLLQFTGKSIELNVADPHLFCTVLIEPEGLRYTVQSGPADHPFDPDSGSTARVTGRCAAFIAAWSKGDPHAFDIRIHGDESVVTAVFAVLQNLQPDLTGPLSRVVGTQIAGAAHTAASAALRAGQELVGNVAAAATSHNDGADGTNDATGTQAANTDPLSAGIAGVRSGVTTLVVSIHKNRTIWLKSPAKRHGPVLGPLWPEGHGALESAPSQDRRFGGQPRRRPNQTRWNATRP